MLNEIKLIYEDIAVGAKESFDYAMSSEEDFSNANNLKETVGTLTPYGTAGEQNQTFLDGVQTLFHNDKTGVDIGTYSALLSGDDKTFESPIILTVTSSNGNYTSQGFTLTFDDFTDTYPVNVNIKWYRTSTLLDEKDYVVNASQFYFENFVQNFNKVVFEFTDLNMPNNRLKINVFEFGVIRTYRNDELGNSIDLNNEISQISENLFINTLDFKLVTKSNLQLLFQSKQPLKLYINDNFKGLFFVKEGKRVNEQKYKINAEDYIGIMDSVYFEGGIYTNKSTSSLIEEIFTACNVPYQINGNIPITTLTGYIGYTTCREALKQVLFACGMVCNTAEKEYVEIFNIDTTTLSSYTEDDIIVGQSSSNEKNLTEVRVTEHFYKTGNETTTLYDASSSGTCTNKLITFDKPYHTLTITDGTIVRSGSNFAIITITSSTGTLTGKNYVETTTEYSVKNENINVNDLENIITIQDATLVGINNAEYVANKVYDYYLKEDVVTSKIVDLQEGLGKTIRIYNTYLGDKTGVIEAIKYNGSGNYVPEVKVR